MTDIKWELLHRTGEEAGETFFSGYISHPFEDLVGWLQSPGGHAPFVFGSSRMPRLESASNGIPVYMKIWADGKDQCTIQITWFSHSARKQLLKEVNNAYDRVAKEVEWLFSHPPTGPAPIWVFKATQEEGRVSDYVIVWSGHWNLARVFLDRMDDQPKITLQVWRYMAGTPSDDVLSKVRRTTGFWLYKEPSVASEDEDSMEIGTGYTFAGIAAIMQKVHTAPPPILLHPPRRQKRMAVRIGTPARDEGEEATSSEAASSSSSSSSRPERRRRRT